ncbi:unnamed protein product [Calicophoron daubneyi]|uniref:Endonuclease/exonuclease/phosphatase domain-containing protein n=1 Tax=Calicophoron daubneyi TaxID=300641 RepID=A0AAV2T3K3_CALDB
MSQLGNLFQIRYDRAKSSAPGYSHIERYRTEAQMMSKTGTGRQRQICQIAGQRSERAKCPSRATSSPDCLTLCGFIVSSPFCELLSSYSALRTPLHTLIGHILLSSLSRPKKVWRHILHPNLLQRSPTTVCGMRPSENTQSSFAQERQYRKGFTSDVMLSNGATSIDDIWSDFERPATQQSNLAFQMKYPRRLTHLNWERETEVQTAMGLNSTIRYYSPPYAVFYDQFTSSVTIPSIPTCITSAIFCNARHLLLDIPALNLCSLPPDLREARSSATVTLCRMQRLKLIILLFLLFDSAGATRIGSFNIQVFGRKKVKNKAIVSILVEILRRYDLTVIQEIRDAHGKAFNSLCRKLDSYGNYTAKVSERLGKTNSKEQYGLIYKHEKFCIRLMETVTHLADSFERPPMYIEIVPKESGVPEFSMFVVHIDPDKVFEELEALYDVVQQKQREKKIKNLIIAGDMNADCGYLQRKRKRILKLRNDAKFKWIIPDGFDTTVSDKNCAYDRIILYGDEIIKAVNLSTVQAYRFDEKLFLSAEKAKAVSDHFPVEFEFNDFSNLPFLQRMKIRLQPVLNIFRG